MKNSALSIISLIVGVISVSLGFLVYSETLIIKNDKNIEANYQTFKVSLSTEKDITKLGNIAPVLSGGGVSALDGIIVNTEEGRATISNLKAHFTQPNSSATYILYARNDGKYSAYLKSVEFKNIENANYYKICLAESSTSQNLVDKACNNINVDIKIRNDKYSNITNRSKIIRVSDHILGIGDSEVIEITINYNKENNEIIRADGDFDIVFGDIVLNYNVTDK